MHTLRAEGSSFFLVYCRCLIRFNASSFHALVKGHSGHSLGCLRLNMKRITLKKEWTVLPKKDVRLVQEVALGFLDSTGDYGLYVDDINVAYYKEYSLYFLDSNAEYYK